MTVDGLTGLGEPEDVDQQLAAVVAEYLRACESGAIPDRRAILRTYPDLADDLRQFFSRYDRMNQMAVPIRDAGSAAPACVRPGQQLSYVGNYELLEEIARGGMGVVYRARQTTLKRIVAVKLIVTGQLATEQDVQRFRIEAQAAAGLEHPNIVAIHEVGEHEGWHYFSMDFVEGRDLSVILQENLLPEVRAVTYVRQMATAIQYAHQQGILHRDLKPSNILIDCQDQVRITDFGLAMRVEAARELTQTGQILGTPSYMPPEQAQARRDLIGPGSDIYSLGAILYECLTGRAPFRADSVIKTLEQVIHVEAASPGLLNPAVPRDLETICLKCLQKDPRRRYDTAGELAADLQRFLVGEPIHARPVGIPERTIKWIGRHPARTGLMMSSAIAMTALLGAGIGAYHNAQLNQAYTQVVHGNESLADAKRTLERRNVELFDASEKLEQSMNQVRSERAKARRHLYASRMALIQVAEQNEQPERVVQLLRSVIPESDQEEDLRDFEWYHLWRKYHGEELQLRGHTAAVIALDCSPDGQWIASGSVDRTIRIWNARTGEHVRILTGHTARVHGVLFSLDSTQLVTVSADNVVKVWDVGTGAETAHFSDVDHDKDSEVRRSFRAPFGADAVDRILTDRSGQYADPTFNFDRSFSVRVEKDQTTRRITAGIRLQIEGENAAQATSISLPAPVSAVEFSHDGAYVAAAVLDQSVRIWNVKTGDLVCTFHVSDTVRSLEFRADGSGIVAGTEGRLVITWTIPGTEVRLIHQGRKRANNVTFGGNGALLVASCDNSAFAWELPTGRLLLEIPMSPYARVAVSPHQQSIAGSRPDQLIDAYSQSVVRTLSGAVDPSNPFGGCLGCAFSRNGRLVAHASGREVVTVHDTLNGDLQYSASVQKWASCVAFSHDNRFLAVGSGVFTAGYQPGAVVVHELASGNVIFETQLPLDVWCVEFSPDSSMLAAATGLCKDSGQDSGTIRVWSTSTWLTRYELRGHNGCTWSLSFNPSGTRLAAAGGEYYPRSNRTDQKPRGDIKVWDSATGLELLTISDSKSAFYGVSFSPDGTHLATAGGDGAVRIWNGRPLASVPSYEPLPDGVSY